MSNQILVVVEHLKGKIEDITFEMLGKGKEIAGSTGGELVALLLGSGVDGLASQLGAAAKVIYVDDANLAEYNPQAYCKAVASVVADTQPSGDVLDGVRRQLARPAKIDNLTPDRTVRPLVRIHRPSFMVAWSQ
jgi:electron transfer flavoprotein alpha subunit